MRSWLVATAAALVALSCNSRDSDHRTAAPPSAPVADKVSSETSIGQSAPGQSAPTTVAGGDEGRTTRELANGETAPDQLPRTQGSETAVPSMIIRTGTASIEVDTLEPAVAQLRLLTTRLGGYVANSSMQDGRDQLRQATLEVKVPAERFDDLTAGLRPFGKVEHVTVTAEDVGEEYTDIAARVANARRLEERLLDLLASRTGRLQDVLSVERELARIRETIERYEGRLRYLKNRTAVSTLSITLHEPLPLLTNTPGKNVIGDAFVRAWRNFVAVVAALISSLGFLLPLAALVAVAVFLWRRYRKP